MYRWPDRPSIRRFFWVQIARVTPLRHGVTQDDRSPPLPRWRSRSTCDREGQVSGCVEQSVRTVGSGGDTGGAAVLGFPGMIWGGGEQRVVRGFGPVDAVGALGVADADHLVGLRLDHVAEPHLVLTIDDRDERIVAVVVASLWCEDLGRCLLPGKTILALRVFDGPRMFRHVHVPHPVAVAVLDDGGGVDLFPENICLNGPAQTVTARSVVKRVGRSGDSEVGDREPHPKAAVFAQQRAVRVPQHTRCQNRSSGLGPREHGCGLDALESVAGDGGRDTEAVDALGCLNVPRAGVPHRVDTVFVGDKRSQQVGVVEGSGGAQFERGCVTTAPVDGFVHRVTDSRFWTRAHQRTRPGISRPVGVVAALRSRGSRRPASSDPGGPEPGLPEA